MIGLGLGLVRGRGGVGAPGGFSPLVLFSSSEAGEYWPVDPAYLYTDTGATTLVAAVGDQIAAWKGKKYGKLATQATASKRPLYGRQPVGGWKNALIRTNAIGTSPWTFTTASATQGQADRLGGSTASLITASGNYASVNQTGFVSYGTSFAVTVEMKPGTVNRAVVGFRAGISTYPQIVVDLVTGTVHYQDGSVTSVTVTDMGGGWKRITMVATAVATNATYGCFFGPLGNAATAPGGASSGNTIYVAFPQIEAGTAFTAYEQRGLVYEGPVSGADEPCIIPDGTDDRLDVASLALGSAALTVATRITRRLEVRNAQLVSSASTYYSTNGAFTLGQDDGAESAGRGGYLIGARGTAQFEKYTQDRSHFLTDALIAEYDLAAAAADQLKLTVNGTVQSFGGTTAGTTAGGGTFTTQNVGIFERLDSNLPANGVMSKGLIVLGRALTAGEKADLVAWLAE